MIHSNILELVGRTPLVALNRIFSHPRVKVLAKVESKNIGGSIKDRVAMAMIEAAEKSGELTPDKTVIEATSGNTGIGLAMVCAVKGYKLTLIMPDSASEERKRIMRAYGAELMLTPGRLSTDGAIEVAYRLAREEPDKYVLMDQFNNPASVAAHYNGTAMEIWEQTEGRVTHVVAALGTSGTVMGLAKRFRELDPKVVVAAVEPYAGHKIQGLKNMQESYPPGIYDKHALGRIIRVDDETAFESVRRLAREEGLLCGMSSGAALAGALTVAQELAEDPGESMVVFICPDGGERYLSTTLFAPPARQGVRLTSAAGGEKRYVTAAGREAALFTPGPSLDTLGDLESWRRIVLLDALTRYLREKGSGVKAAVGLADMDDRALAASRNAGVSREKFLAATLERLHAMARLLGVSDSLILAPATGSLERILDLTRKLLARGLAYEKLRSVYFDVARDKSYGRASGSDMTGLAIGHTVDLADYSKDNPLDFTLLKRASLQDLKLGDVLETEWGKVRPSWFLQHAASALDSLGGVTVMLAGEVHRFPHLENFSSIWTQAARVEPLAWMVAQPVNPRDAESDGELPDVEQAAEMAGSGAALRMWLLSTSYRKTLVLSPESLAMWHKNQRRLQDLYANLRLRADEKGSPREETDQALYDLRTSFAEAIEDDLGLHHFWPELFQFAKKINGLLGKGELTPAGAKAAMKELSMVNRVLGFLELDKLPLTPGEWPEEAAELVKEREAARRNSDYAMADICRDKLAALGFRVEDTREGPKVFREG